MGVCKSGLETTECGGCQLGRQGIGGRLTRLEWSMSEMFLRVFGGIVVNNICECYMAEQSVEKRSRPERFEAHLVTRSRGSGSGNVEGRRSVAGRAKRPDQRLESGRCVVDEVDRLRNSGAGHQPERSRIRNTCPSDFLRRSNGKAQ